MRLRATVTLRGKDDTGGYAHWPKGSIFDDDVDTIPEVIINELVAGTGTVEDITPKDNGGSKPAKKASPTPKSKPKKTSSTADKKVAPKKKAAAKPKTKKTSAKKKNL